jgi:hypothetical protein
MDLDWASGSRISSLFDYDMKGCWNVLIQKGCSFSFSFRKEGLLSGDYIHDLLGLLSDLR